MPVLGARILHVADTALWMAQIRASETRRRDRAFADPLAEVLSGEHGRQITRSIPLAAMTAWGMVLRTAAIDRLLEVVTRQDIDTVVNLGAGLDTRPYRMNFPADLRWLEVDFPELLDAKQATLADKRSACPVTRVGMDLTDRVRRRQWLASVGATSRRGLVISEGVIPYFSNIQAFELAQDLHSIPSLRYWIQDFDNAGTRSATPKRWEKALANAPMCFQVPDWFAFFAEAGWRPHFLITSADEADRLQRPCPPWSPRGLLMRALPATVRRQILGSTGAVLMEKSVVRKGRST